MILQDLFEESGYRNIINEDNAKPYHLSVDVFYNKEGQIPSELKFLYISKTKDELFFVLDGRVESISNVCKKWEQNISAFMAFGSPDKNVIRNLKYNVVMLVLFEDFSVDRSKESSLNIARKIFLPCTFKANGDIEIAEEEVVELPFYLIKEEAFEKDFNMADRLKLMLPKMEQEEMDFLGITRKQVPGREDSNGVLKKNFKQEEYEKIKRWLETNADTES
ncbi:MAG: hypothetical protein HFI83_07270 [Eubacterium sp.]|nr:hypothetical protein [Eubacterium sp.]